MLNEATESHEEGSYFGLCMYDQSAAFNLLTHSIFLSKLEILGFDQLAVNWYSSFLSNRLQYVHIEGKDSAVRPVTCGAPQGSSSWPPIWLIYTLDLYDIFD